MLKFPVDSVHVAMSWYFNQEWKRAPQYDRTNWPDGVVIDSSPKRGDPENIWDAVTMIAKVLDDVGARSYGIIRAHYYHKGATQAEVALEYDLRGGPRSVRYIRDKVLNALETKLIDLGVVSLPKYSKPKLAPEPEVQGVV